MSDRNFPAEMAKIWEASNPEAERKAVRLHDALSRLLTRYKELLKDTDSRNIDGEDEAETRAEKALFDNRPPADWEQA